MIAARSIMVLTILLFQPLVAVVVRASNETRAERSRLGASFYVTDYGAVADGSKDNTGAFQAALNAAAAAGGGTVFVPAPDVDRNPTSPLKYYSFDGFITVPANVTLRGPYQGPMDFVNDKWAGSRSWTLTPLWGAILGIRGGASEENGTPFVTLAGPRSSLRGLHFFYPDQEPSSVDPNVTPIRYPWTVKTAPGAADIVIENCVFANSYRGVYMEGADRHLVRQVTGEALDQGVLVDNCTDGVMDAIEYHWYWTGSYFAGDVPWPPDAGAPSTLLYELTRGVGIEFRNVRNEVCRRLQFWGLGYPFVIDGRADVQMLGTSCEWNREGVLVNDSDRVRLRASGLGAGRLFPDSPALRVSASNKGDITAEGVIEYGSGPISYYVSGSGKVTWRAAHLDHGIPNGPAPIIQLSDAGSLKLLGADFKYWGGDNSEAFLSSGCSLELSCSHVEGALDVASPAADPQLTLLHDRDFSSSGSTASLSVGTARSPDVLESFDNTPNTPLTLPIDGLPNTVSVLDFGASTRKRDNTAAFQAAIDRVGMRGGGTVYVPPGRYRFKGKLYLNANTTLQGSWTTAPQWPIRDANATILEVVGGGRGQEPENTAFINFKAYHTVRGVELGGTNETVRDLIIYYPRQRLNRSKPINYPWAIAALDENGFVRYNVLHVFLVNPYRGIKFKYALMTMREVYGQPISVGWACEAIADWPEMTDVEFRPFWAGPGTRIANWIRKNGTAFDIYRIDGFFPDHLKADGYLYGFRLRAPRGDYGVYGGLRNLTAVNCRYPISVEATYFVGAAIADSVFSADPEGAALTIDTNKQAPEWEGHLIFSRCTFSGAPCLIDGPPLGRSGTTVLDRCSFTGWNRANADSYALDSRAGNVTILDSQFDGNSRAARIGSGTLSAIVIGNTSNAGFDVSCESGRCSVEDNR